MSIKKNKKCTVWWSDRRTHRERIPTIEFIILSPCWFYCCCFVVRTLKLYSFSKSPLYNTTVLSIVVIMLYISSSSFSFKSKSSICLFNDWENCKRVKKRKKKKTEKQIRLQNKTKIICQVNICKCNNFPLRVIKLNPTIQGYKIQLYIVYKETCLNPSDLQGKRMDEI